MTWEANGPRKRVWHSMHHSSRIEQFAQQARQTAHTEPPEAERTWEGLGLHHRRQQVRLQQRVVLKHKRVLRACRGFADDEQKLSTP